MTLIEGKISEILPELNSGFISCRGSENVFFSPKTEFVSVAFNFLKVDQMVQIEAIDIYRGLFAKFLQPVTSKSTGS